MVGVVPSNAVNIGFQPQWTQIKIDILWLCAKQTALNSKSKDWLARSQNKIRYAQGQKIGKPNNFKGPSWHDTTFKAYSLF